MTEIIENLFIGGKQDSENPHKYDYIINCTKNLPLPDDVPGHRIPVDDTRSPDDQSTMLQHLPSTIKVIHELLSQNRRILCHCKFGQQRSCCVVAAYIIAAFQKTVPDAVELVRSKKRDAFFYDVNFAPCLHEFWQSRNEHV